MKIDYDGYNYNSYCEFFDDLKPNGRIYELLDKCIFRGQSEDWKLIPSLFRKDNLNKVNKYVNYGTSESSEMNYRYAEYNLLSEFYNNANSLGLYLPASPFPYYDYMIQGNPSNFIKFESIKWLPDNLAEIAALAQHYGLITRLLDWSFDIYIALYFAAIGAVKKLYEKKEDIKSDKIVIWALSKNIVIPNSFKDANLVDKSLCEKISKLKCVIPNYYYNPNINAQKGILTYWESEAHQQEADTTSLDELLLNFECPSSDDNSSILYKITIPALECHKIIKHLSKLRYNCATVFPSYYGAVNQIFEADIVWDLENNPLVVNNNNLQIMNDEEQLFLCLFRELIDDDKIRIKGKMEEMIYKRKLNNSTVGL